jgi:hypothetical protein
LFDATESSSWLASSEVKAPFMTELKPDIGYASIETRRREIAGMAMRPFAVYPFLLKANSGDVDIRFCSKRVLSVMSWERAKSRSTFVILSGDAFEVETRRSCA